MKTILILINVVICFIALVNGHGYLGDPLNRGKDNGFQNSDRSYYNGGDHHICGNTGPGFINRYHTWAGTYIPNTQLTGPIQRTYKSGEKVTMRANFFSMHNGIMRIKLCKLNSPTDILTLDCFDQEILKISANSTRANNIDEYTIRTSAAAIDGSIIGPNLALDPPLKLDFTVQLPLGLTCDNCVILWEWSGIRALVLGEERNGVFPICLQANGSAVPIERDSDFLRYDSSCLLAQWRNCADVKIESNPDHSETYVPNPFVRKEYPQTFTCPDKKIKAEEAPSMNATAADRFTGAGQYCVVSENNVKTDCTTCRLNCMDSSKVCPENCHCYWFPRTQRTYQIPK